MRISQAQINQLIAHARADHPNECCGLIGSKDGRVSEIFEAINAAASPLRYELDPRDLLRIFEELDEKSLDLGAIYHSHTRSAAYPSQTDINLALYPDSLYVIVSIAEPDSPDVRAFRIVDRQVTEVPLEVDA